MSYKEYQKSFTDWSKSSCTDRPGCECVHSSVESKIDVAAVQTALSKIQGPIKDAMPKTFASGKADGKCGEETKDAIKAFQLQNKLECDACVGPVTLKALEDVVGKLGKTSATSAPVTPVAAKPTKTTAAPVTDKPPSDREVTQGKDISDVSGPEILIIGDSTSNNIVVANPTLQKGAYQPVMGYVDGNGKKVPYIKKANGKIDYWGTKQKSIKLGGDGKARFPGYSGHASHGGAGTTYIKNSLVKLLARDESYVPKVAIISMGYNDPPSVSKKGTSINNFKSIISALKQRGVKDIRLIEPRADKGSYKRNADLIRPDVYDLADSVVKIVPNPTTQDGGPPRGDGVHYTPSGARRLFKDAMSGLAVSSDVQPSGRETAKPKVKTKIVKKTSGDPKDQPAGDGFASFIANKARGSASKVLAPFGSFNEVMDSVTQIFKAAAEKVNLQVSDCLLYTSDAADE